MRFAFGPTYVADTALRSSDAPPPAYGAAHGLAGI
jgi:hypothetical protein